MLINFSSRHSFDYNRDSSNRARTYVNPLRRAAIIEKAGNMVSSIIKRLLSYLEPLVLIVLGCFGSFCLAGTKDIILTVLGIVVVAFEILTMNKRSQDILSCTKLSHRIFGKLWLHLGKK